MRYWLDNSLQRIGKALGVCHIDVFDAASPFHARAVRAEDKRTRIATVAIMVGAIITPLLRKSA